MEGENSVIFWGPKGEPLVAIVSMEADISGRDLDSELGGHVIDLLTSFGYTFDNSSEESLKVVEVTE